MYYHMYSVYLKRAHHITVTWNQDVEEHMWVLDITNPSSIYHLFLWKTSCHIELVWPGFFLLLWFWVLGRVRLYTGYYMWAQACVRDSWLCILSCLPLGLPHLARQRGPGWQKGAVLSAYKILSVGLTQTFVQWYRKRWWAHWSQPRRMLSQ